MLIRITPTPTFTRCLHMAAHTQGEGEVKILGRLARHWASHDPRDSHGECSAVQGRVRTCTHARHPIQPKEPLVGGWMRWKDGHDVCVWLPALKSTPPHLQ